MDWSCTRKVIKALERKSSLIQVKRTKSKGGLK